MSAFAASGREIFILTRSHGGTLSKTRGTGLRLTHLVNRDVVERNYVMRAEGVSVSLFFSRPNYRIFSHILLPRP